MAIDLFFRVGFFPSKFKDVSKKKLKCQPKIYACQINL